MTRAFITFLALLLVVALSACGESATVQSNPTAAATQHAENQTVTKEQAIEIALQEAGLSQEAAGKVTAELDKEKNETVWEVEIETQEKEYSYAVNAANGTVTEKEIETEKKPTVPPTQETVPATSPSAPATEPAAQPVTKERAVEIALQAAGLTKEEVFDLEAELDQERNGLFWEVSFETKQKEYDYEIHAYDGTVVKAETEKEENRPEVQPTEPSVQAKLTKEQAVEIALNAAGLTRADVSELEAELDEERNISVWEVSFETGQTEYSYEINANDGKLINAESERND